MNNSTKLSSITFQLISLYSQNLRKDGHLSKTVGEKEENNMRPSLSRYDNNGRQGQDFLGNRLKSQGIIYKNFREYPIAGNKGKNKETRPEPPSATHLDT